MSYFDSSALGPISVPSRDYIPDFNAILDESYQTDEHYQSPESLAENYPHVPKDNMVPMLLGIKN